MRHALFTPGLVGTVLLTSLLLATSAFAQSGSVVFAGTDHQALGTSVLSVDAARTLLTIDGLSANGGGASHVLDREAGSIRFGDGVRGRRPSSGGWNVSSTYRYGGGSSGEVDGGVNAVGDPFVAFDHGPVGTNSVTVTLHRDDQIVANFDSSPLVTLTVDEWPAEVELGIDQGEMLTRVRWDLPVIVFLPDGTAVDCDEAKARSDTGGALLGEELGTLSFEGYGLDLVQFEGERFRVDGSWFEVEGNLLLERSSLGHELTHVLQNGSPGTYTEYGPEPCVSPLPSQPSRVRAGLQFESLLTTAPPEIGTRTDFLVYGALEGQGLARIPTHSKEWTNFSGSDPGMTLIGGFVELGAASWTVQVFDDGLLVDSESGLGAAVARVKEYVVQTDQTDLDFLNQRAAAHVDLGVDQEVTILASVPRTVVGDRVHIIPEQVQVFPDCVQALAAKVRQMPDVTLKRGLIDAPLPRARWFGLTHELFGDAILARQGTSVEIRNEAWGSTATGPLAGGVRREAAGLGGYRWNLAGDLDPQSLPEGSRRSFRVTTQDVTGRPGSAGLDVFVENGVFSIAHDLGDLGSSDADVEAWLGNQPVFSGVLAQQGRVLVDADFDEANLYETADDLYAFELAWPVPQNLVIAGQAVMADRISERLRHKDRAVSIVDFEALTSDTPGVTVTRASVHPRGTWWSAVGDVAFADFTSDPLRIDFLDPSTPSGLEVESQEDPQGTAYVQMQLEDPGQFDPLDGDEVLTLVIQEEDEGSAASSQATIAPGTLVLTRDSAQWTAEIDFSAAGYSRFRVLADGVGEVHSSASAGGAAFSTSAWPRTWVVKGAPDGLWIDLGYPSPTLVEAPDGTTVTTSGLTIVVEGAPRPPFGSGLVRFLYEGSTSTGVRLTESVVGVGEDNEPPPHAGRSLLWRGAAPSPFNPRTLLSYELTREGRVELIVYDVTGRRVRTLVDGTRPAGPQAVVWEGRDDTGRDVASGVYLVWVRALGEEAREKVVLLR